MKESNLTQTKNHGTEFWNDSCDFNELNHAVKEGATGATSNPVIVGAVLNKNLNHFQGLIDETIVTNPEKDEREIAWSIIENVACQAAKILEPVYSSNNGKTGKLCLQVNPLYYNNSKKMIDHGLKLAELAPNIAIKVPATEAGINAMEELTAQNVTVNATVSFSVSQAIHTAEAIEKGLQKAQANGFNTETITPYITLMVGRIDDYIKRCQDKKMLDVDPGCFHWAGVAVFKNAYKIFKQRGYKSKILAAAYRNHMHWDQLIGNNLVLSMPYKWWNAFNSKTKNVTQTIEDHIPEKHLEQLYDNFPEFRKIYDQDTMTASKYSNLEPAIHTLLQFAGGLDQVCHIVRQNMLK
ncbi:MAG: transaldolase [Zetaproteobacteria bacterium]|nr:transaldolase [Pseudobdellovibrionaceae bacterium]